MAERHTVRQGSLVEMDPAKVQGHAVYGRLIGSRWKVTHVSEGRAYIDAGMALPVAVLKKVPQKKGKTGQKRAA